MVVGGENLKDLSRGRSGDSCDHRGRDLQRVRSHRGGGGVRRCIAPRTRDRDEGDTKRSHRPLQSDHVRSRDPERGPDPGPRGSAGRALDHEASVSPGATTGSKSSPRNAFSSGPTVPARIASLPHRRSRSRGSAREPRVPGPARSPAQGLGHSRRAREIEAALLARCPGIESLRSWPIGVPRRRLPCRPQAGPPLRALRPAVRLSPRGSFDDARRLQHLPILRVHSRAMPGATSRVHGRAAIETLRRVRRIRRRSSPYDCMMLYSGGKDSTYALCATRRHGALGLRLHARQRLHRRGRQGEHPPGHGVSSGCRWSSPRHPAMNAIFRDSLSRFANVCNGCFKTIYTLSLKRARELGIPIIVTGLSRGQMFETRLTEEMFRDGRCSPGRGRRRGAGSPQGLPSGRRRGRALAGRRDLPGRSGSSRRSGSSTSIATATSTWTSSIPICGRRCPGFARMTPVARPTASSTTPGSTSTRRSAASTTTPCRTAGTCAWGTRPATRLSPSSTTRSMWRRCGRGSQRSGTTKRARAKARITRRSTPSTSLPARSRTRSSAAGSASFFRPSSSRLTFSESTRFP